MGLLLDPTNEDVISILSRLFPGKSIGDVVNSRAADPAKLAVRAILNIQPQRPQAKVTHDAFTERWDSDFNTDSLVLFLFLQDLRKGFKFLYSIVSVAGFILVHIFKINEYV